MLGAFAVFITGFVWSLYNVDTGSYNFVDIAFLVFFGLGLLSLIVCSCLLNEGNE